MCAPLRSCFRQQVAQSTILTFKLTGAASKLVTFESLQCLLSCRWNLLLKKLFGSLLPFSKQPLLVVTQPVESLQFTAPAAVNTSFTDTPSPRARHTACSAYSMTASLSAFSITSMGIVEASDRCLIETPYLRLSLSKPRQNKAESILGSLLSVRLDLKLLLLLMKIYRMVDRSAVFYRNQWG